MGCRPAMCRDYPDDMCDLCWKQKPAVKSDFECLLRACANGDNDVCKGLRGE